jgi:hypothetical protein
MLIFDKLGVRLLSDAFCCRSEAQCDQRNEFAVRDCQYHHDFLEKMRLAAYYIGMAEPQKVRPPVSEKVRSPIPVEKKKKVVLEKIMRINQIHLLFFLPSTPDFLKPSNTHPVTHNRPRAAEDLATPGMRAENCFLI